MTSLLSAYIIPVLKGENCQIPLTHTQTHIHTVHTPEPKPKIHYITASRVLCFPSNFPCTLPPLHHQLHTPHTNHVLQVRYYEGLRNFTQKHNAAKQHTNAHDDLHTHTVMYIINTFISKFFSHTNHKQTPQMHKYASPNMHTW